MITEIKDTIFEKYQVRKSKKQKTAFIEYVKEICEQNGISCTVEKKGTNRNIVMGASPEDSEFVITGHYDTCAKMIIPNFITPKNLLVYILYQIFITVLMFGVSLGAGLLVYWPTSSPMISYLAFIIAMVAVMAVMMAGPANKHTANDNTSGVITVLNTMLSMTEEQRAKVCFVLFDNEEIGLFGSSAFAGMHKKTMKNKPLLNFDCVSDGDYLFAKIAGKLKKTEFGAKFTEAMEKNAEKYGMTPVVGTSGFYPSDQSNFKCGVGIAALNRSKLVGLYMDKIHTKNDTVFNERNIECLTAAVLELV